MAMLGEFLDQNVDLYEWFEEEERQRRPRWIRERTEDFDVLDDVDFKTRYRLSKTSAVRVLELIEEKLEFPSDMNCAVSPMNQLLVALRYYATGSNQLALGDLAGVSKPTAHRIIHRVSAAIASLKSNIINFPNSPDEIQHTQMDFYKIAKFPKVIGALDCTHIKIKSVGGAEAEVFRNRKGFFSLNTQVICNANLEIIDIVCRWPGSSHDQHIFNSSRRRAHFEAGTYGDSVLLGDAGYRCKSYLITPLDEPNCHTEQLFNESQIRTRNVVERLFGCWKRRFPVLALGVNAKLENIFPIVVATAVLHNILRKEREDMPLDDPSLQLASWDVLLAQGNILPNIGENPRRRNSDENFRQNLINNYFYSLH